MRNLERVINRRGFFYAGLFTMVGILALLAGCTKDPVYLRHPQTGTKVQCGPYSESSPEARAVAAERERGCIADYQRQGFERVMESGQLDEIGGLTHVAAIDARQSTEQTGVSEQEG